jgi:hypothetical protein
MEDAAKEVKTARELAQAPSVNAFTELMSG